MTRSENLLARVSAADPIAPPQPPTPEQQREAALLLERVMTMPVVQPRVSRTPRRRRTGLVAVAAAASLAVALVVLLSPFERTPGLAERAYAAVTAPKLFHVVVRSTYVTPDLNASPGERREAGTIETESWYDTRDAAYHSVSHTIRDGRRVKLAFEAAGGKGGTVARFGDGPASGVAEIGEDGRANDVFPERFDPTAKAKEIMRDPDVREDGEVTIAGRRAKRLVIDRPDRAAVGPTPRSVDATGVVLVDAQTLYPIELREQAFFVRDGVRERTGGVTRYSTFETLPRTPENLRLLKMGPRP